MIRFHLAEDTIDKTDIEELIGWLQANPRLTKDKVTIQFEEKWNSFLGRKYLIFCSNVSGSITSEMCRNAQETYSHYFTPQGQEGFCSRFEELIKC